MFGIGNGEHRDAARQLHPPPGIPGVERKSEHDAKSRCQDHCLEQRGYGQAIQHNRPPKIPPIWAKKGKYLDSASAGTTADPRSTDLLRNVERPMSSSFSGTRNPTARYGRI